MSHDTTNKDRANIAACALAEFAGLVNTDDCDVVADLLANLMHFCSQNGQDFDAELLRGRANYEAELLEELELNHPTELEYEPGGNENIYFHDGAGNRYFFKGGQGELENDPHEGLQTNSKKCGETIPGGDLLCDQHS